MDAVAALTAFSLVAGLLTITPGLDTALVLRTATVEGAKQAMAAGTGIVAGLLTWGFLAALGLGAILSVSQLAFQMLQGVGAAYLLWLGGQMIRSAMVAEPKLPPPADAAFVGYRRRFLPGWLWRGFLTNMLNPKVGVFYVSFLPQFIPAGVPVVPFSLALAAIHATMGLAWFAALTAATRPLGRLLVRPGLVRAIDGATGAALVAFGVTLALDRKG